MPTSPPLYPAARLRWLPFWILGVGLALTATLGAWSYRREATQRDLVYQREGQELARALANQVQAYVDTLPGLRVFGVLKQAPNDAEFRNYVEAIALESRYPGLSITFIAERVAGDERAAFEEKVQGDRSTRPDGHPGFAIVPPGSRADHMVLRHLYPEDPPAFGYDLFDPAQNYRAAVEAAIDSGAYIATEPLQLARDRGRPRDAALTSVVVRAALYRGGTLPASQAARRRLAFGVAGIGFRIQPLVRAVLPQHLTQAQRLRLVDTRAAGDAGGGLLFDSDPGQPLAPERLIWQGEVVVADRSWTLSTYRRSNLAGQESTSILLLFGAGLSLALAGMTRALVRANLAGDARLREVAAALVAERDQLRQSEARFRMLFEHSFDAVLRTEPDGRVLAANPAACALFGASEAELCALARDQLVDRSDERLAPLLATRRQTGRVAGTVRMRRVDGSLFEAEVSSNLYADSDGRSSTSMIIRDVTERLRLTQRLEEKQRLEAIGTLAGGVAHDFNNTLAAILGNVALAEDEIAPDSPALGRLRLVHRAAERARSLVRQILTFSRRAPREQTVQPLQPLVEDAIALLRSTLPPAVHLSVTLPDQALWVRVDGAQAQQMIVNLCTNAWQALKDQRGTVRVTLARSLLAADAAAALGLAPGPWACLQVHDDGHGMDASVRARIFEPFFTTKPLGEGTGLGLAVVHGVVNESGGAIRVDSTPGDGSCFSIYLPLHATPPAAAVAPPERPLSGAAAADSRLLYVDDDVVVGLTAQALLARAGFAVDCVDSGAAALQACRPDPGTYAAVITDFNMPGMSGLALAQALRDMAPGLPVIVVSGLVTDELQARARELGVVDVLPKEDLLELLVAAVRRTLARVA